MFLELKEGAFLVGDAHYSHKRVHFLEFLKAIKSKDLKPTQLILLGDIFDTLFGEVSYTHKQNSEAISLLNNISKNIEVVYLEGNHDFNLATIFPKVKVFPIESQPITMSFGSKKVLLSHGDNLNSKKYHIYSAIIRNSSVLRFLSLLDRLLNHKILKKLDEYLAKKDDCREFSGFFEFMQNRLSGFECDYFVEGHFHQNKRFEIDGFTYINLAAFACNQRYFIVESTDKFIVEKLL
ncbi:MAG: metallophosphoesterase [Sulfurimonas sp.]|jgi:UDP-2,3-diacylglucosamine hydrolase|nr:metallophosphoesterase [Sulfurimonadaceae bacterium]